ncbi:MAG TPA: DNA topoisomerase (ATP-hydrolyzing) subunit A [Pseudoneobacillus sp.]|nr:DNA topoisomerase (ATP-hydrolyzing) subunit A [Pseudoneobacillus sp.]
MAVIERKVEDIIRDNMLDYGAYIILQRAIPDLRDGLKPGQRRILYTMQLEKATKLTKSANIEGAVMKLHPHGSTYGTMVNMAQKDRQQNPLIVGKGNFSQATSRDLQPGASRYTEVKLSDMAVEMLSGLRKNLVDFIPNYDGTMMQPEVLPVKFPLLLTQPSNGVALGMASTIPSFNLTELANAVIKFIREKKKVVLVPDFATGGYIVNDRDIFKKINLEGKGSVTLRGKATIDGNNIEITEIPYTTTREAIMDKIIELAKSGKLKEVTDVEDLTGLKGMLVEVRCRRGTDMNVLLEKLYQLTPLQSTASTNLTVIHNKSPRVMSVWEVIEEWVKWRKSVIVRGLKYDIDKKSTELHLLRGLEKVLLDIDKAIEIIRKSQEDLIIPNLVKTFQIDEVQAEEVANMRLRYINRDYILKKIKDIESLAKEIEDLKVKVESDEAQNDIVVEGLEEVRDKYGKSRMTKLIEVNKEKIKAVKKEIDEVPNYAVRLYITKEGYVKKLNSGLAESAEAQYVKPGDEIIGTYDTMNHAELLVFGSDSCCYKIKISEIEDTTNKALGAFIPSLCEVKEIVGTSVLDDQYKFIIIVYDNHKIAKIKLDSFGGNRKKLSNSLAKNAKVIGMLSFKEEGRFKFKTTKSIFNVPTVNYELKERWTQGTYGPRKGVIQSIEMA